MKMEIPDIVVKKAGEIWLNTRIGDVPPGGKWIELGNGFDLFVFSEVDHRNIWEPTVIRAEIYCADSFENMKLISTMDGVKAVNNPK